MPLFLLPAVSGRVRARAGEGGHLSQCRHWLFLPYCLTPAVPSRELYAFFARGELLQEMAREACTCGAFGLCLRSLSLSAAQGVRLALTLAALAELAHCFSPVPVAVNVPGGAPCACARRAPGALPRNARALGHACQSRASIAGSGVEAAGSWKPRSGKTPLVILVGFLGCTPGIIAKYSQMYEAMGIETVEVLPSIRSMLLAHQGWRGRGSRAVRGVCELIIERAPDSEIVVHIFSNNGFIFFGSCMLAEEAVSAHVSAVILDSCPCYITPRVAATGLISATQRVEASEAGQQWAANFVKAAVTPLLGTLDSRQRKVWQIWSSSLPVAPHLFMCSNGDGVIPAEKILEFAQEQRARLRAHDMACDVVQWETAQHCGMLRENPSRYSDHVSAFLNKYL